MAPPAKIIRWEKWSDPVATHVNRRYENEHGDLMVFKEDDFSGVELDNPCSLTRFGIVPYHESNSPGKLFKFWVGHTNFELSLEAARAIEEEPGVESLDIYTRYRFRLGVGRLFNDEAVKKAVEVGFNSPRRVPALALILATMRGCPDPWAVALYPNKDSRIVRARSPEEVNYHCQLLRQQFGAQIITEEDLL